MLKFEMNPITGKLDLVQEVVEAITLNDLSDVTITAVADNDFIQYNASSGEWENESEPLVHEDNKMFFRDSAIFIHSDADGSMVIEADEYVLIRGLLETTIGVPGDIKLGDSSERDMYPETTLKMNLGKTSRWFTYL